MKINTPLLLITLLFGGYMTSATARVTSDAPRPTEQKDGTVVAGSHVKLDASEFKMPGNRLRYQWQQIGGEKVRLANSYNVVADFFAPQYNDGGRNMLSFVVVITNEYGYQSKFMTKKSVIPAQPPEPPVLVQQRNENEFLIDGKYHPMGHDLVAVIHFPEGASADNPVPGCAIIHGSGGLFEEDEPGDPCSDDVHSSYAELSDQLVSSGVATILPSSFYSRSDQFCEDNDDDEEFIQYAPAPFFNGDDVVARDDGYKRRRVAIRAMDMLATMEFFCDLEAVDCAKTCMVGTSNGGTSIMSYAAQSLPTDLIDFMDDDKRPFESNNSHSERTDAFANFPALAVSNITLNYQLRHRPLPMFAQLISAGCSMRDMVPDIEPEGENQPFELSELYYPAGDTELTFEVGTADGTPDECYTDSGEGLREIQARYYEQESGIAANQTQYIVEQHQGGTHSLLNGQFGDDIRDRLNTLVDQHLLP